jgi:nitroreductase
MTFDDIVSARHSVRAFDPSRPVPQEAILAMCEAARLAPSACNAQVWRFIAVTDPKLRGQICTQGMGPILRNKFMRDAPLIMVGCADLDIIANKIGTKFTGIEYYQLDMGIAMEHIVLKATELGLGTCWVGWINEDNLRAVLGIPKRVRVMALIAVGYSTETAPPKQPRKAMKKILFGDLWGTPFAE